VKNQISKKLGIDESRILIKYKDKEDDLINLQDEDDLEIFRSLE
jgi:hypothetical protein